MKQANTKQKQWMKDISEWAEDNIGALYQGYVNAPFQLHHVVGRSAKHNKVPVGHEFIIPVPIELHDVNSNHPLNVTHNKKKFVGEFGSQSSIFQIMILAMEYEGYDVPNMEVYNSIMSTNL